MFEQKDKKDIEKITRDIVFFGSNSLMYVYKKTLKISKAIYIVTDLIKDKEPVKWSLRLEVNKAVTLHSDNKDIKDSASYLHRYIISIKGLVSVATFSGNISQMNSDLIISELDHVLDVISELKSKENEFSLTESFFLEERKKDAGLFVENLSKDNVQNKLSVIKTGPLDSGRSFDKGQIVRDRRDVLSFIKPDNKDKRSEDIFRFIKQNGSVTIKDIAGSVSGCSEKTIQRELVSLLDRKVIKREGERRWSKYSVL